MSSAVRIRLKQRRIGADDHEVAPSTTERTDLARRSEDAGFTIPELVVSMLIFGVLSTVIAAFMTVGLRTIDTTSQRLVESKDAQIISTYLDADVQSQARITASECSKAAGESRLVGFEKASGATTVYYASTTAGTVTRRECGVGGALSSARAVVRNLGTSVPGVFCDNGACTVGSAPDKVILGVTTKSGYAFNLAGTRRTFTDPAVAAAAPVESYPRWGRTLTVLGNGSQTVKMDTQAVLNINGDVAINSTSSTWCKNCTSSNFVVNDTDGVLQQPITDPLINLAYPDVTGMLVFTADGPSGPNQGPGVYRYVPAFKDSTTFAPGIYVFEQGLAVSGSDTGVESDLGGTGVLFFNGCARNSPPTCANGGRIQFNGGSRMNLTGMSSGDYAGIVIMQARENDSAATLRAGGAAVNRLDGVVYLPKAKETTLNVEPGAFLAITALIVDKVDFGSLNYVIGTYP